MIVPANCTIVPWSGLKLYGEWQVFPVEISLAVVPPTYFWILNRFSEATRVEINLEFMTISSASSFNIQLSKKNTQTTQPHKNFVSASLPKDRFVGAFKLHGKHTQKPNGPAPSAVCCTGSATCSARIVQIVWTLDTCAGVSLSSHNKPGLRIPLTRARNRE